MKYANGEALRIAIESRISALAHKDNTGHTRLRKRVVFEQILARLITIAPNRWILKGGVALDLRLGDQARTTKDLDLGRQDTEEAAREDLLDALNTDLGDFFTFKLAPQVISVAEDDVAVRFRIQANLGERRFESIVLDIGFGDPLPDSPDLITNQIFLGFAGFPALTIPTLPIELHVAQKLHAYTRTYPGGHLNTRVKDLVDINLIQATTSFAREKLLDALHLTFSTRSTHSLPTSVPEPPVGWETPYRTLAQQVGLDPDVAVGHQMTANFLDPILSGAVVSASIWDPEKGLWVLRR